jgi:hypothetical protein
MKSAVKIVDSAKF